LVVDDVIPEDDSAVPDLIPQDDTSTWATQNVKNPYDVDSHWSSDGNNWSKESSDWNHTTDQGWATGSAGQGLEFDKMDYMNRSIQEFMIDGRVDHEETNWWNPIEREKCNRPGPGILSPVLAEELHDSNHSLFSINILPSPASTVLSHPSKDQLSSTPSTSSDPSTVNPPTEDEIRTAVPHPNAYYCPKDNGWVILSWKSSSVPPPLARSFANGSNASLPDQARRRRTGSCIEEEDQPFGKMNKSHHFHKYEKAVDSHKLTPPFRLDEWQIIESVKLKRRAGTIMSSDLDINAVKVDDDVEILEKGTDDDEGKLLDLYVCCQCSFYCVASGVIPGVIPKKYIEELIRDKRSNPPVGKTGDQAVVSALETFTM
jgi:ubiquitin carboxyl-terminal hydrolase 25/28